MDRNIVIQPHQLCSPKRVEIENFTMPHKGPPLDIPGESSVPAVHVRALRKLIAFSRDQGVEYLVFPLRNQKRWGQCRVSRCRHRKRNPIRGAETPLRNAVYRVGSWVQHTSRGRHLPVLHKFHLVPSGRLRGSSPRRNHFPDQPGVYGRGGSTYGQDRASQSCHCRQQVTSRRGKMP
jgi:hypothetical protein